MPRPRAWLRRSLLTLACAASLAAPHQPVSAGTPVPAPEPPVLPAATAATLEARYGANRANIAAAADMAAGADATGRAGTLRAMSARDRTFFAFDARHGTAVEVVGNLAAARRVAVLVPGANTTLDTFGSADLGTYKHLAGGARVLHEEMRRQSPDTPVAVVAWLGYRAPAAFSVELLTTDRAERGAPELRRFVGDLERVAPSARISLLCHSYGSVVCGRAAHGLHAADMVFYASPGTGADRASELRTEARVWAGVGSNDWIAHVPNASVNLLCTTLGLGADPASATFGARRFDAGRARHDNYLRPGSVALTSMARIATGDTSPGTH
ncbi:alpha/beta hydrolase [Streptomyces gamaensis]|uniref:Alpha/beta hydrolase n=1 Tax=Streptomyces gamaensis TaxID=1763542 RepID=A0ABW0YYW9_9ACTN